MLKGDTYMDKKIIGAIAAGGAVVGLGLYLATRDTRTYETQSPVIPIVSQLGEHELNEGGPIEGESVRLEKIVLEEQQPKEEFKPKLLKPREMQSWPEQKQREEEAYRQRRLEEYQRDDFFQLPINELENLKLRLQMEFGRDIYKAIEELEKDGRYKSDVMTGPVSLPQDDFASGVIKRYKSIGPIPGKRDTAEIREYEISKIEYPGIFEKWEQFQRAIKISSFRRHVLGEGNENE